MERDEAYLLDILLAARKAIGFVKGMTWAEFAQSELHQSALVRPLEIIGEAARRISAETQQSHPEIPWQQMIGMRNRLIHAYFDVNLDVVWKTVTRDLPSLKTELEKIL